MTFKIYNYTQRQRCSSLESFKWDKNSFYHSTSEVSERSERT
jgi:hypothetical protein